MTETPLRPVMVRLPPDLYDAVKRDAAEQDRTIAQTIRLAIRRYIARATS